MLPLPHLPSWYALEQFYLHSELCCESDQLGKDELDRTSSSDGEVFKTYIQSFILKFSRKIYLGKLKAQVGILH